MRKVRSFFRLYLVPDTAHGGGPGVNQAPNLLGADHTLIISLISFVAMPMGRSSGTPEHASKVVRRSP